MFFFSDEKFKSLTAALQSQIGKTGLIHKSHTFKKQNEGRLNKDKMYKSPDDECPDADQSVSMRRQ